MKKMISEIQVCWEPLRRRRKLLDSVFEMKKVEFSATVCACNRNPYTAVLRVALGAGIGNEIQSADAGSLFNKVFYKENRKQGPAISTPKVRPSLPFMDELIVVEGFHDYDAVSKAVNATVRMGVVYVAVHCS